MLIPSKAEIILILQDHNCYLCNKTLIDKIKTLEHVKPKSQGGRTYMNVLIAHSNCNNKKGSRKPYPCELLLAQALGLRAEAINDAFLIEARRLKFERQIVHLALRYTVHAARYYQVGFNDLNRILPVSLGGKLKIFNASHTVRFDAWWTPEKPASAEGLTGSPSEVVG